MAGFADHDSDGRGCAHSIDLEMQRLGHVTSHLAAAPSPQPATVATAGMSEMPAEMAAARMAARALPPPPPPASLPLDPAGRRLSSAEVAQFDELGYVTGLPVFAAGGAAGLQQGFSRLTALFEVCSCLSLTFRCLSLAIHCLSLTINCLSGRDWPGRVGDLAGKTPPLPRVSTSFAAIQL